MKLILVKQKALANRKLKQIDQYILNWRRQQVRFTFESDNFTLNIFQDIVFTYR